MAKKKFPSNASILKNVPDDKALSRLIDDQLLSKGFNIMQTLQGPIGPRGPKGETIIGPPGKNGLPGRDGIDGIRGSKWFSGKGAPIEISGAISGDKYLDVDTDDVYELA